MTLILRPAQPDDLMAVGALHQRSRVAAYGGFLPAEALVDPSAEAMGRYWAERWTWERDSHLMTLAEYGGELAGFTYLGPDDLDDPSTGLLNAIHLEPGRVGTGIGRALMVAALDAMRARGRRQAALWVLRENRRARRFYERGGWSYAGTERDEHIGTAVTPQLRYQRPL